MLAGIHFLNASNNKITNVANPTNNSDLVTKDYVDSKDHLARLKMEKISFTDLTLASQHLIHTLNDCKSGRKPR